MTINLDDTNFVQEVVGSTNPVLVDFYADWCPPCKQMVPVVDKLSEELQGKVKVVKVNVDKAPGVSNYFGIQSIPTFAVITNNEVVELLFGAQPKESLLNAIQPYIQA